MNENYIQCLPEPRPSTGPAIDIPAHSLQPYGAAAAVVTISGHQPKAA